MGKKLSDFFVGTPRAQQSELLEVLESNWAQHDVFCIRAPVAFGKTKIAEALQAWTNNAVIAVPTNVLQQQFLDSSPATPTLWRRGLYNCAKYKSSCDDVKRINKGQCRGCVYKSAVVNAKKSPTGVFNYWMVMAHKLFRQTMIFDEAHQLVPMIQDLAAKLIWWHEYKYPKNMHSLADVIKWIESVPSPDEKLRDLLTEVKAIKETSLVHQDTSFWRGKSRSVIKIIPLDTKDAPPTLWPHGKVQKIVLMSATIGPTDIEDMGLKDRRILYVDCDSPIPPASRPVYAECLANMSMKYQVASLPILVKRMKELAEEFKGQKGIIHAPYSVAEKIRQLWQDPRLVFHTRSNKQQVYQAFRDSLPESGQILVASGLYTGIDLPGDLGRWQVITKVPYPYLGDPGVAAKNAKDPKWFQWEAAKIVLQASGRICRTPADFGTTIILDSSFVNLYKEAEDMFPPWFRSALLKKGW